MADLWGMYGEMSPGSKFVFKPIIVKGYELLTLTRGSYFFGKVDDSIPCISETKDASETYAFTMKIVNLLSNKDLSAKESKSLKVLLKDSEKKLESKNSKQLACIKKLVYGEKQNTKIDIDALKAEFNNLNN